VERIQRIQIVEGHGSDSYHNHCRNLQVLLRWELERWTATIRPVVPVGVNATEGIISQITIEIERLRVIQLCVRDRVFLGTPAV
jgi:hypothetical protein